jgi:hypothetical protein
MSHQVQLSGFVAQYLALSRGRRRIFQFLRWYQSRYPKAYPKVSRIAKWAGVSERAIQKFFNLLKKKGYLNNYLTIHGRKNKWGGDSSNQYVLNNNFKMAMDWLSIHSYLNAPRHKNKHIISSIEKQEIVHPPSHQKFTPSSINPLSRNQHTKDRPVWIHPKLKNLGIDMQAKIFASRYATEFQIIDTLEACLYQEKKKKIPNPSAYFIGTLRNKMNGAKLTKNI